MNTRTMRAYSFQRYKDDKSIEFTGFTFNEVMSLIRQMGESGDVRNDEEEVVVMYDANTERTQRP